MKDITIVILILLFLSYVFIQLRNILFAEYVKNKRNKYVSERIWIEVRFTDLPYPEYYTLDKLDSAIVEKFVNASDNKKHMEAVVKLHDSYN